MKRIFNWTKKPITWGGYMKIHGIYYMLALICGLAYLIIFAEWFRDKGKNWLTKILSKVMFWKKTI